jgi:hypothetical protein
VRFGYCGAVRSGRLTCASATRGRDRVSAALRWRDHDVLARLNSAGFTKAKRLHALYKTRRQAMFQSSPHEDRTQRQA